MAFDEDGQATTFERRIEICERAYHILVDELHFPATDIIFDPNVLAVATGMEEHNNYALDFIHATEWIRHNLQGAHVSGGVSNLSFSFRGNNYIREAMHAVFLYHTIQSGQDFGIVNPATKVTYADIPDDLLQAIDDVLLNRRADATEQLIKKAEAYKQSTGATSLPSSPSGESEGGRQAGGSVEERLSYALTKGVTDHLEADLTEALEKYGSAIQVIEGPLMDAMNHVGELFGAGKMFLPQVVKTARTMKRAVEILSSGQQIATVSPLEESAEGMSKPRVLLATVKGDVHDIGKNIVSVVLGCNGYEVIDLGVMVPAEEIVNKAIENKVDIIGLSGLITPSLEEMVNVARALQERHLHIPLMIGGATTSELHTALKIAPVYGAPVVWMKDASQNAQAISRLLNKEQQSIYVEELHNRYTQLCKDHEKADSEPLSLEEARRRKPDFFS